jgi:hypothetical protein
MGMLKGINLRSGPGSALCSAGDGQWRRVDHRRRNFPADSLSRGTAHGRPVRIGGDTAQVVEAVLPLDTFVEDAVGRV